MRRGAQRGARTLAGSTSCARVPWSASYHEAVEECRELCMPIERKNVRDELVRPHDHHASPFAIDAAHREDVLATLAIGAEHLLVVAQSVPPLRRQQEG